MKLGRPLLYLAAVAVAIAVGGTLFGAIASAEREPDHGAAHAGAEQETQPHGHDEREPEAATALVTLAAVLIAAAAVAFVPVAGLLAADGPRTPLAATTALGFLAAAAAVIHLGVVWEHLEEYAVFGAAFAVTGLLQLGWAALVVFRPVGAVLVAGAVGSLGIAAAWLLSRTVGLPIGPDRWTAEPVGVADALATAFELLLVVGATWLLLDRSSRTNVPLRAATAIVWGLGMSLVALTAWALLAAAGRTAA